MQRLPRYRYGSLEEAVLNELVAQLVEQRPFKAWVLGSSPSELTTVLPLPSPTFRGHRSLRSQAVFLIETLHTKSFVVGLVLGILSIAATMQVGELAFIPAGLWIRALQSAAFALLLPGILCSLWISGGVHSFHLWIAALVNFVFWFTFGWSVGVLSGRIRSLWNALHGR